ncbi:MAG TPA: hypothetical protein VE760_06665, partial [Acidimicrobiales bacterium]|nr:hypothetical protein [Acidimicrobiales bacterium]
LDRPRTPPETLTRAREVALANGVLFPYTGNVHDTEGSSTYCPGCGARVVERDWYAIGEYHLTGEGACRRCGTTLPGRYHGGPGGWGPRRMAVRLSATPRR